MTPHSTTPDPRDVHPDGHVQRGTAGGPSLPSYTGKFTTWGGFNANGWTMNGTFTFNVRATGSDGSTFSNHNVEHFNQRPDGTVHEFFRCH
jgi:hypothetical protein